MMLSCNDVSTVTSLQGNPSLCLPSKGYGSQVCIILFTLLPVAVVNLFSLANSKMLSEERSATSQQNAEAEHGPHKI